MCPSGAYCGHPIDYAISLQEDGISTDSTVNYGITTFTNIGKSLLTVFQVVTLDGWTKIMYTVFDSSNDLIAMIYFCLIVMLGSNFLINLILAVILDSFMKVQKKDLERELRGRSNHMEESIK